MSARPLREVLGATTSVVGEHLTGGLEPGERVSDVEFEDCTFERVTLVGAGLIRCTLRDCTVVESDLSRVDLTDTLVGGCTIRDSRALGVAWAQTRTSGLIAEPWTVVDSRLDDSSFIGMSLIEARFVGCRMRGVDFDDADLRRARFDSCDLAGARFVRTDLRDADLRSSVELTLDPRDNTVTGLRLDPAEALGLLTPFGIVVD
ncbi:pentapeptide repeat-containing protein [Janibacter sp. GXQ6167]|uniref:pentapeptide repeat-containing protein n=1 Tax=Janibacter sp. GXQ6167 TaxID=3240791 RepID=UPI0035255F51